MSNYLSIPYIKDKWGHAGFQKYFRNTGWMFVGKILSLIIAFIATAYIARNLGPTNYGQLSYAVSYVGLFGFLAALGIDQILYRDLIKFPEKRDVYLGTSIILKSISGLITIFICFVSALFLSDKDVSLFLIFIISLSFILNPFQLINYLFQADAQSKYPTLLSTGIVLILNILKIVVIAFDKGVIYLASILLLEALLYTIGFLILKKIFYSHISFTFDPHIAKSILKDSFPLIFATAFFAIYARIDQVMIKNMITTEAVGLYDSAVRVSELWYFIPNIIIISMFPAIIHAKKTSDSLYYKRLKKLFILIFVISFSSALITTLFSKYLILIIFGTAFIGAVQVLNIYVWSNIGAAINQVSQQVLIVENLSKTISTTVFFGMICNVLLNITLIPIYGITGAAIATFFSYFVPFVTLFMFKKSRRLLIYILKN